MKNQYFGDNKDLFKYDLVWKIVQDHLVDRFTFIPILTETDDKRSQGKPGTGNRELVTFLDACIRRRNIKELKSFFEKRGIIIEIYREDEYFSNNNRKRREYFEQISCELLSKSIILVDPDIGLSEDKSDKKHILYSEIKTLYDRMDRSSILMIFQYRPRMEKLRTCCRRISDEIIKKVGNLPIHIASDPVIFFFLTRDNNSLKKSLGELITKYREVYNLNIEVT